jgi:CubicO group peptidase (beta-lactamase class C family)
MLTDLSRRVCRSAVPDVAPGHAAASPAPATPATATELGLMQEMPARGARLVTLDNWQSAPQNRWSFQHAREMVPTVRASRGAGPVAVLPEALRSLDALSPVALGGGRHMTLAELLAATYTDGFLVLKDGELVYERYLNGMTPQTPHLLQSVSKSLTGTLAAKLLVEERLLEQSPVTDVLHELKGTGFDGATVRDVLDMRTGTRFSEDYFDPEADVNIHEAIMGWRRLQGSEPATNTYDYFGVLINERPHGGAFGYRSVLADLLCWLCERATRTRFHELFASEIWSQLGAEQDADVTVDREGFIGANAGFNVTLRDLARFGQMHLSEGWFNGRRIVPAASVLDTVTARPDVQKAFADSGNPLARLHGAGMYRNQWWVVEPDAGRYYASGVFGQLLYIDRGLKLVVAKLSTWPRSVEPELAQMTFAAIGHIASELSGR